MQPHRLVEALDVPLPVTRLQQQQQQQHRHRDGAAACHHRGPGAQCGVRRHTLRHAISASVNAPWVSRDNMAREVCRAPRTTYYRHTHARARYLRALADRLRDRGHHLQVHGGVLKAPLECQHEHLNAKSDQLTD